MRRGKKKNDEGSSSRTSIYCPKRVPTEKLVG
jgi:hypothetical protein